MNNRRTSECRQDRRLAWSIAIRCLPLVLPFFLLSCREAPSAPLDAGEAVSLIDFSCGDGSTEKIERWGSNGASRGCYRDGLRDGAIIFWEEGYLNLEGFYSEGQKDGTWTAFNSDGSIFVEIFFDKNVKKGKKYH